MSLAINWSILHNIRVDLNCEWCGKLFWKPLAWYKRKAHHYCSRDCYAQSKKGVKLGEITRQRMSLSHRGERNYQWKGGRYTGKDGYIHIRDIERKKYIREHQLVMEKHIGRKLIKGEVVHHKNGIRTDNRLSNLELLTISEHKKLHGNQYAPKHIHYSD